MSNKNVSKEPRAEELSAERRTSLLSHDLRSAMSDVIGGLSLIKAADLDASTRLQFERISASGEALARLLDQAALIDAEPGSTTAQGKGNVIVAEFLDDLRRRWTGGAHEKGIEFSLEIAKNLPAIMTTDRLALERIVSNLIGNAIKFTDKGKVILRVSFGDDDGLRFQVVDEGPGFSDSALSLLYEYLGRPGDARKPGSGLGLFIAKDLSDQLGGVLSVSNRPTGGAATELVLPHEAWLDRSLRVEKESVQASETPDLSHLKILLAEDNTTNQLVVTQMLGVMGASFVVASDGLEALECIQREAFDLALLDIEMPRMSGLELIKTVRKMEGSVSQMPLVALTAYVMREHRDRIYEAGADGIIAKPLMSIRDLGVEVLGFFNGAETRGEGREVTGATQIAKPTGGSIVDREIFDSLIQTIGPESSAELLGKIQADTDSVAQGIAQGQKTLDLAEIRAQTHILISVAGAIGATGLQMAAQRLNTAANRDDAGRIEALCEECLVGLSTLQEFILLEQTKHTQVTA